MFMQFCAGQPDLLVSLDELTVLKYFLPGYQQATYVEAQQAYAEDIFEKRIREAFARRQKYSHLDFRTFQTFLGDLELRDRAPEIDTKLYRAYFRQNWFTRAFACGWRLFSNVRYRRMR